MNCCLAGLTVCLAAACWRFRPRVAVLVLLRPQSDSFTIWEKNACNTPEGGQHYYSLVFSAHLEHLPDPGPAAGAGLPVLEAVQVRPQPRLHLVHLPWPGQGVALELILIYRTGYFCQIRHLGWNCSPSDLK